MNKLFFRNNILNFKFVKLHATYKFTFFKLRTYYVSSIQQRKIKILIKAFKILNKLYGMNKYH